MQETAYLLRNRSNAKRLMSADNQRPPYLTISPPPPAKFSARLAIKLASID